MRDTLTHPITKDEVLQTLDIALDKFEPFSCGDLEPYILSRMKALIVFLEDDDFKKVFK